MNRICNPSTLKGTFRGSLKHVGFSKAVRYKHRKISIRPEKSPCAGNIYHRRIKSKSEEFSTSQMIVLAIVLQPCYGGIYHMINYQHSSLGIAE